MNTTGDFLSSKRNDNHVAELISTLKKQNRSITGVLSSLINKNKLSSKNAEIALLLLNESLLVREEKDWYRPHITQGSRRYNALKDRFNSQDYWDSSRFPLLVFLFGAENAPFVKKAWEMIPSLMYQTGYTRRSFRGTGLDEVYFTRQLNFLVDLIYENNYDLTLSEYAIYSNNIAAEHFAFVYAGAIESGDKAFKQQCIDTLLGKHPTGKPSRSVIKGMLLSNDEECWNAVEMLLLTAQRQEGLRQSILESLDETSIGAMKRFIKVILEHKLTRFSSVVRAVDVWAGLGWESEKETTVRRFLEMADFYLSDPSKITTGVSSKDNTEVYMALWAQGVLDVHKCKPLLETVLAGSTEKITLGLYFTSQVGLSSYSIEYGKRFLHSDDPIILCQAAGMVNFSVFIDMMSKSEKDEMFAQLENRLELFSKKTVQTSSKVFSWLTFRYGKEIILDLMINLLDLTKENDIDKIVPHFQHVAINHREKVTSLVLSGYGYSYYGNKQLPGPLTSRKRDFAFSILKDGSEMIRSTAIKALSDATLTNDEVQIFEGLLTRKAGDFRRSVIELIIKHGEKQVQESANRLIKEKSEDQRLAGLDLLIWLKVNSPSYQNWIESKADEFNKRPRITSKEEVLLSTILRNEESSIEYNDSNGFGLFNPAEVPKEIVLKKVSNDVYIEATSLHKNGLTLPESEVNAAIKNLADLFIQNKDYEYTFDDWENKQTTALLGNTFTNIRKMHKDMTPEERFCNYPLPEIWRKWFLDSGLTNRDLFLINLFLSPNGYNGQHRSFESFNKRISRNAFIAKIPKISEYEWQNPVYTILQVVAQRYQYEGAIDYLAGLNYTIFNLLGSSEVSAFKESPNKWSRFQVTWREQNFAIIPWNRYEELVKKMPQDQFETYWNLAQWKFLTVPKQAKLEKSHIPDLYDYARALKEGLINQDTLTWRIMMKDAIRALTQKVSGDKYDIRKEFDFLQPILDECRNRILEIELFRGDTSTPVTALAQNIQRLSGIDHFIQLLKALGKDTLNRGYIYVWGDREYNKKEILSTLLKNCYPPVNCDQKEFNRAVEEAGITEKRLCECSTYAPQWLPYVSNYLGWKDMESAVWWLHAHTNGHHDQQTESETAKYSAVEFSEFKDGAVDIDWFRQTYKSLGAQKWKLLYDAAKYISDGGGHKRGLLYSDVILGKTKIKEITERINDKRNQDYLRVYGVIPLSKANPKKDVLKRYQFLQNFKKESKQFGSQRQASEAIAVRIAMDNLARTSGFPDPIRLQWAMEQREAEEIIENSQNIEIDNTQLSLEIDEHGKSALSVIKNGKKLKSIPAKLRKEKEVLKLKEFNKQLREQYRRTRKSLESAMINGDIFSKEEIENLSNHPVVAPMLKKLVLISEDRIGFWKDGKLADTEGLVHEAGEELKIAHCVDLFEANCWSSFQKYCFKLKMVQPFKQIFRELYVPTEDELHEKSISRRYAGHQVQPRKTVALLKGQNWTVDYEDGLKKVHHKQNTIARMFAMADWFSPADVESPTLETVEFFSRKTGKRLTFDQVDKRIFSETMRDIDLVVSVAHVGEVDPEASQSSIELRSVIIEETCRLFKLKNVDLLKNHAKIKGELGQYSVHLGSGVCHKVAGSSLSIIPVHSQHRGRMFLPFIDDDPKTAEIISKILLLAKDNEIQDPTVLRQL